MNRRQVLTAGGTLTLTAVGAGLVNFQHMGSMEEYRASVAATRSALASHPALRELIRFTTLAPSGHNTQPWRFRLGEQRFEIVPDYSRRTPIVDPDDHHLFTSLGCAAETFTIASGALGCASEVSFDAANGDTVVVSLGVAGASNSPLFEAITRRQSTRTDYDGLPLSVSELKQLAASAVIPGVDLLLITDRVQIGRVRDLIISANSVQLADPAFISELKRWYASILGKQLGRVTACLVSQAAIRVCRRGSVRRCLTWCFAPRPRTSDTHDSSTHPRTSPSSSLKSRTETIGCGPDAPASVSLFRRRRLAFRSPSSTNPSRWRALAPNSPRSSGCPGGGLTWR